jgi:hypothetical protein
MSSVPVLTSICCSAQTPDPASQRRMARTALGQRTREAADPARKNQTGLLTARPWDPRPARFRPGS